jgi:hypothetical protein
LVFEKKRQFCRRKLSKIAENCDHNIVPWCILRALLSNLTVWLPDGLFSNQKIPIWEKLQGLRLENVDIFYGHLEYFMDVWDIL